MIFDGENMFFNNQELSASTLTSDVVAVGQGEAACPLRLYLAVSANAGTGTLSTVIETAATDDFGNAVTLGTFTAVPLSAAIPRGNLGYIRLKATSTYSKGTITAGIVLDDDIKQTD